MNPSESFLEVMARLRAGDERAAAQVFNRFAERLIALARSRLDARLRQKVDPEDLLQSVCKSFFVRHARGEFEVGGWDGLWALLTVLTVRKCAQQAKHYHAARRDVRREAEAAAEAPADGWDPVGREPTPEEAAELADAVERLMRGLDERYREILALSLQGKTAEEISAAVGYARRTVRRVLDHVRDRLRAEAGA
jgi:RNA polymerase sigma-70 factor (ECF subfamily)